MPDGNKEATIRKAVVWKLAETVGEVANPFFERLKVPVPTEPIDAFVILQSTLEHPKEVIQKSLWMLAQAYSELRKLGEPLPNTVENALTAYLLTCRVQDADGISKWGEERLLNIMRLVQDEGIHELPGKLRAMFQRSPEMLPSIRVAEEIAHRAIERWSFGI